MDNSRSKQVKRCLVIGGCGFVGRHLAEKLLERGHMVSIFDIRSTFVNDNISFFVGDICNKQEIISSLDNIDIVFHCATPSPLSNNKKLFEKVNSDATKTLIEACLEKGAQTLILTSSASVVYGGKDIKMGTEELPYAKKPLDYYTKTKIQQEKLVLGADNENFNTISLRPHGIFGPRDPHLFPTIARLAKERKLNYIIGKGNNLVDFTYIDNVVDAHILAAEQLKLGSILKGKAYNITNDEPVEFWSFISNLTNLLGYPAPKRHLPYWLVLLFVLFIQVLAFLLKPIKTFRPVWNSSSLAIATTNHYYSCLKAQEEMGYRVNVKLEKGLQITLRSSENLFNDKKFK